MNNSIHRFYAYNFGFFELRYFVPLFFLEKGNSSILKNLYNITIKIGIRKLEANRDRESFLPSIPSSRIRLKICEQEEEEEESNKGEEKKKVGGGKASIIKVTTRRFM